MVLSFDMFWELIFGAAFSGWFLSYLLYWHSQSLTVPLRWPGLSFLALLCMALLTLAVAWWRCVPLIYDSGGFSSGFFDGYISFLIALFALPGVIRHRKTISLCFRQEAPFSLCYFWAWVFTQGVSVLACFLFYDLGDLRFLPLCYLASFFLFAGILCLGTFFGLRWGRSHRRLPPLLGSLLLSAVIIFLVMQICRTKAPMAPDAGLRSPGFWYGRLCFPSVVLLDWFYPRWTDAVSAHLSPVLFLSLLPHVLFTVSYLFPTPFKRGYDYVKSHLKN